MKEIDEEMEERIQVFLESMAPRQTDLLNRLEKEARVDAVPIIRTQTRSLLQFILTLKLRTPAGGS